MQSASQVQPSAIMTPGQVGVAISTSGFDARGWYPVGGTDTVMAGLLANGLYPEVFYGINLQKVRVPAGNNGQFRIPWWYRSGFKVSAAGPHLHTYIRVNGVIPSCDIWINGHQVATREQVSGAYTVHVFDVTRLAHPGLNIIALKIYPASPWNDFIQGWINWNPYPPDNNMGIWRSVQVVRTGPASLSGLHVLTDLAIPSLDEAKLTVKVDVHNNTDEPIDALVQGRVAGIGVRRTVRLLAGQTQEVAFKSDASASRLTLVHPKVWWPVGLGSHPLYDARLTVVVDGAVSDRSHTSFGVRRVTSHLTKQGYRQFVINGVPLLIRGAGWAPDMFLRNRPKRLETEFKYVLNTGLNTIRLEGKLERPDFYRLADQDGILVLAGWECCSKWEAWAKTGAAPWTPSDMRIARESMKSEAVLLRNHPSVIAFLIGSDNAPPNNIAKMYVDTLRSEDWPDPIISAASLLMHKRQIPSPSGMKMSGPYTWVPPRYWYTDKVGGAFGFLSESGAGTDIPRLPSLRAMLRPIALLALWKYPHVMQYHSLPLWSRYPSVDIFDKMLAARYGKPTELRDYVEKAQLANYEAVRAEFEAYDARMDAEKPSTGLIYWMLNSAWPTLVRSLIPYDLNPSGAYFGAQKANEPVHIQYSYTDRSVVAINHSLTPMKGLGAIVRVYDLSGRVLYARKFTSIDLAGNHVTHIAAIPTLSSLTDAYFVELQLTGPDKKLLSRNVYWLPRKFGQLDYAKTNWYSTAVVKYANLKSLSQLPRTAVKVIAHTTSADHGHLTTVTVSAPRTNDNVALFVHLSLRNASGMKPLAPILWSGNDVTLWPGETITLTAKYAAAEGGATLHIGGWNVSQRLVRLQGAE